MARKPRTRSGRDHAELAAHPGPDLQGRGARNQGHHGEVEGAWHADLRPAPVRALRERLDQLRGRAAQRRFGQRAAPDDQAPWQGSQGQGLVEIMLNSPLIQDLIFKGEVHEIKAIMAKSKELGMQTFDQHLFELYENGSISYEDALRNADSVNELRLMIKLHGKEAKDKDLSTGIEHLNIV